MAPLPNAKLITSLLRHAGLEVTKPGGHLFLFDQPETVEPIIRRFLEGATPLAAA